MTEARGRAGDDPTAGEDDAVLERLAEVYDRALALDRAGDAVGAAEHWREMLRLDPQDHAGARLRLGRLADEAEPDGAPEAYVRTLFDQSADRFDAVIVDALGYRVPQVLAGWLAEAAAPSANAQTLDLGCGTGLMALALSEALGDAAGPVDGVDLSEEMLALADARELYRDLYVAEAVEFLRTARLPDEDGERLGPWDLILATDVAPYMGALGPFAEAAAVALRPDGRLAFSTETLPEAEFDARGWKLGPHRRFHHSPEHVRAALAAAGLEVRRMAPLTIRYNEGRPEPGHLYLAARPGASPADH